MADFVPLPAPSRGGGDGRRNDGRGYRSGRGRGGRQSDRTGWGGRRGRGDRGRRLTGTNDVLDELEEMGTPTDSSLCIAVQGCCHGELDAIYARIQKHEEQSGRKVDLLLCCGDFQSLRNVADYHSLAVPPKYRSLGSFCRYYSGEVHAPVLTIFIGGNHEASQALHELYYGGWVAPNIYYLGAAGVVNVGGVRIGGISGIYKSHDYTQGRFERPPYDRSTLRSVYHVRNVDVYRLKSISPDNRLDIMLSHDWPQGIEQHGDTRELLRRKPFFRDEVQRNELGSPPNRQLLDILQPKWWFAAHLHVRFKALVRHSSNAQQMDEMAMSREDVSLVPSQVDKHIQPPIVDMPLQDNQETVKGLPSDQTDEISASVESTTKFHSLESSKSCAGPDLTDMMTQFLSLDKCLPRRQHLSIVHVPCKKKSNILEYDLEWLTILKATHHLTDPNRRRVNLPSEPVHVLEEDINFVREKLQQRQLINEGSESTDDVFAIPMNFCRTVLPYNDPSNLNHPPPLGIMGNPQTDEILDLLELNHIITVPFKNTPQGFGNNMAYAADAHAEEDDNEIDLDMDDEPDVEIRETIPAINGEVVFDDNEIDLEDDDLNMSPLKADACDGNPNRIAPKKARIENQDSSNINAH